MNAINFIKQHGVEKAKEVVKDAPKWATGINLNSLKYFGGDCFCRGDLLVSDLKRLIESVDLVKQLDFWSRTDVGFKKAKEVIGNNTLQASYYQPSSGFYYRYGHNSLYVVRDGEWKEIYGGMDSNTLIHTDRLKKAIADYKSIYSNDMSENSHIDNHISKNCKVIDYD